MRFGQSVFSSASSSPPPSTALSSGFWRCLFGGRLPLKLYCLRWFIAVFTDKPTPRNTFPSLNLRHCSPQAQAFCSSAHLPGLSLRLPSPAPLRRECSECSLVVVSRGLSAAKGINLNTEKWETYSVMRGSFILLDPRTWRTNCFQLWIGYLLWNYMNQIYISHRWTKKRRLEEYWFIFCSHAFHMLTHRNTDKHKV